MSKTISIDFKKKLYRSRSDRMIAGVCGGLAKWLGGVDATWIRILFVLAGIAGWGAVLYLIMMIVVPEEPKV